MQLHYPEIELRVTFEAGKQFRYIHVNDICIKLGEDITKSLHFFHAFSGCDTTSFFNGDRQENGTESMESFPCAAKSFLHIQKLSKFLRNIFKT